MSYLPCLFIHFSSSSITFAYQEELLAAFGIRSITNFSKEQIEYLNDYFAKIPYPSKEQKGEIAKRMGFTVAKVDGWFRNKRWKDNKKF